MMGIWQFRHGFCSSSHSNVGNLQTNKAIEETIVKQDNAKISALTTGQLQFLEKIFPDSILTSPEDMLVYASDASLFKGNPLVVVHPESATQIQELLRWANQERIPVYPRSRGTNTVGGCVPNPPGIVVSTAKMNKIIEISSSDFVGICQPGVITAEFQEECEKLGLFYPPDAASAKYSTIGGNVSTCAGGMRALKYGVTRDFVLGLEAVLPTGELIHVGGRSHKNVVGLDLVRLLTGSEGTLAFLTSITLKLLPKPEASASLMVGFRNAEEAMHAVSVVFGAGMLPTTLEFIGENWLRCINELGGVPWPESVKVVLLFKLDGSPKTLPHEIDRLSGLLGTPLWSQHGVGEEEEYLWQFRRKTGPAAYIEGPMKINEDIAVPRGSLGIMLERIEQIGKRHGKRILTCGHVGDGNIHVNIMSDPNNAEDWERSQKAKDEVMREAVAIGGTISGEHGIGLAKDITEQMGPVEVALMRRIKAAFDPNGILNPGKGY